MNLTMYRFFYMRDESLFRLTFRFHGVPYSFRYATLRREREARIYEFQRAKVSRIEIKNFLTNETWLIEFNPRNK